MAAIDLTCIIDDDPIFIFSTKRILKRFDFCENFEVFENGKDAINALKPLIKSGRNIPDVILLDLNMPIMDGWQFLDEFKKLDIPKKITLYIVSSSIDPRDINKAKEYELVSDFIIKPLTRDRLVALAEDILL